MRSGAGRVTRRVRCRRCCALTDAREDKGVCRRCALTRFDMLHAMYREAAAWTRTARDTDDQHVTAVLHVGFIGIVETPEHLARLHRPDGPVPTPRPARSGITDTR